jgi:hypothetical protein
MNTGEFGGGVLPREASRFLRQLTGHRESSDTGKRSTVTPAGEKIFGKRIEILTELLMKLTSSQSRVVRGSKFPSLMLKISPTLRLPQKRTVHVVQTILLLEMGQVEAAIWWPNNFRIGKVITFLLLVG